MKFGILAVTVLGVGLAFAEYHIRFTEAASTGDNGQSYLFIDLDDASAKKSLLADLKEAVPGGLYAQYRPDKDNEVKGPLLVVQNNRFMMKEKAGRDLGIGGGLCLGSCLFVMVAGEKVDPREPPQGLYAQVGDRRVEGGAAMVPSIMGCLGLLFIGKGFIELFLPPASSYGEKQKIQTTDEIIAGEGLDVKDKRNMVFNEMSELRRYVIQYTESTL